jgi:hypothetical protein
LISVTRASGSTTKASGTSVARRKRPRAARSVAKEATPEAVKRMATALASLVCAVDHPNASETLTGDEKPSRDYMGAEYIAAIAEQRPGVEGHGYPGAQPDWDQPFRLVWTGDIKSGEFSGSFVQDRSIMLPDWMALPLVRRLLQDPELRDAFIVAADKPDESDSDRIEDA